MTTGPLPALEDFASATLTARTGELFNPPGLTNFHGCLQAAPDLLAVQHVTFAPYSLGESWLGTLVLNDCALHTAGFAIDHVWRPDRIERRMRVGDHVLESTTVMGVREQTVTIALRLTNEAAAARPARLRILAGEGVIHAATGWNTPYSPRECPAISTTPWTGTPPPSALVRNHHEPTPERDGLLFTSRTSRACAVQATSPAPDRIERRWLEFDWNLAAGESRGLHFLLAVGAEPAEVLGRLARWRTAPAAAIAAAEADWRAEIKAAFTPGNDRYSGHVPLLLTTDTDLRALYLNAVISVMYFKREHPAARFPRTYTTLLPRYWVTTSVINDWSLTALLLVLLDPACVRRMLEVWLERDIHRHFGTDYVSGDSSGNWYSCNDYAMTRLITTYLRVTGDFAWLDQPAGPRTVAAHLGVLAAHHRTLDRGTGLADYGDRNSLLEAVGTYEHEVASLNAANVWILRENAALRDHLGDRSAALSLRAEADALVPRVQALYVTGRGYWHCRQPDGSLVPVRHVWDFIHTLNFLHADLPAAQIDEMVAFFRRELMTPAWLAALSPLDEDAGFSLRPDHQWNGSYPGWVALALGALAKAGREDLINEWLPGLARTAAQGPFSQAHLVETYAATMAGGARKAPTEWPYINDWAIVCAGGFFDSVLLDFFGLEFGYDGLRARPRPGVLPADAVLLNVPHHGALHRVDASGVHRLTPKLS